MDKLLDPVGMKVVIETPPGPSPKIIAERERKEREQRQAEQARQYEEAQKKRYAEQEKRRLEIEANTPKGYEFRNEDGMIVCYATYPDGRVIQKAVSNVEIDVNRKVRMRIEGEMFAKEYEPEDQKLLANLGKEGFYASSNDLGKERERLKTRTENYWLEWRKQNERLPVFLAWSGNDLKAYYVREDGCIENCDVTNRRATLPSTGSRTEYVEVKLPGGDKRYLTEPPGWKEFELMPGAAQKLMTKKGKKK